MLLLSAILIILGSGRARLIPDSSLDLREIAWQPERTNVFLGSPSILRLPSGDLLASADRFGDGFHTQRNVSVYRSTDEGDTWQFVTWVKNQYWSNLFQVDSNSTNVYLLGTATDGPAPIKLAMSHDMGQTWKDEDAVILFGEVSGNASYETGPTPTLISSKGRLYRAMERLRPPFQWGRDYEAVVLHTDAGMNLTDPSSWTLSKPLPFNDSWMPESWSPRPENPGYLEGNMIEGPDGEIYDLLRFNSRPYPGNKAVLLRFDVAQNVLSFDSFVDLPGGHSKFVVRRDKVTGYYLTLANPNTNESYIDQRNILKLYASKDLREWREVVTLLEDDTGFAPDDSVRFTGFHYVDWRIDGNDILYVVRTAYRGAVSYHNSNRITFKALKKFRTLL
eukprot:jgi/Bigna1/76720/fgenesh1_pg.43_\